MNGRGPTTRSLGDLVTMDDPPSGGSKTHSTDI